MTLRGINHKTSTENTIQLARPAHGFIEALEQSLPKLSSDLGEIFVCWVKVIQLYVFSSLLSWVLVSYLNVPSTKDLMKDLFCEHEVQRSFSRILHCFSDLFPAFEEDSRL